MREYSPIRKFSGAGLKNSDTTSEYAVPCPSEVQKFDKAASQCRGGQRADTKNLGPILS
jgi:hypothetical protein